MKKYITLLLLSFCLFVNAQEVHYEFDGDATDATANGHHLSIAGDFVPLYEADHAGNSNGAWTAPNAAADAASKFLIATGYKAIGGSGARTVTAWFRDINSAGRHTIVSWGENTSGSMFNVMIENGKIRIEGGACSVLTADGYNDDKWHHLAVTFEPNDGGTLNDVKIYVNASPVAIAGNYQGTTVINTNNISDLQIGKAIYGTGNWYKGALDDVRIYAEALTLNQIQAISGIATAIPANLTNRIEIEMYPNPVESELIISIGNELMHDDVNVSVSSLSGQHLLSETYRLKEGHLTLNAETWPKGILIVSLTVNEQLINHKIIKK